MRVSLLLLSTLLLLSLLLHLLPVDACRPLLNGEEEDNLNAASAVVQEVQSGGILPRSARPGPRGQPHNGRQRDEKDKGKKDDDSSSANGPVNPLAGLPADDPSQSRITYQGGPLMTVAPATVYFIYYGAWKGRVTSETLTTPGILENFVRDLSGSPWLEINTGYSAATTLTVGGSHYVTKSSTYGNNAMSDNHILLLVKNTINAGIFPISPNAIYLVITAPEVSATSGFCRYYCGWHNYAPFRKTGTTTTVNIKYSFVGAARRCMSSCSAIGSSTASPNRNPSADAMVSILAHEITEALTDPELNAWWDRTSGMENADKCAWRYGDYYVDSATSNANWYSIYNVAMGPLQRKYLIQQNWVNESPTVQACGLSKDGAWPWVV
jgi:hypothetical protein